jgi:hypothetical protein
MKRKNITLDSTEMACRLTSRSSHAERDGEKRSLTEVAVYDFAARCWTNLGASDWTSPQRTTWRRLFAAAA